ncbi:response regulator transcription factor [Sorangium sp. So ce542]|uniref:response regulator transcription factor n=1 Tax=Sorangium sp. So ce542 TaxID=3133316 RepID=UPI003F5FB58E
MTTRVLVVEDDPGVAAGLVRGLVAAGLLVELATNGRAGLESAIRGAFDLVVLDLMLPERSGLEILEDLGRRRRIPVIVLTARTDLPDRLRSFELGAIDYVPKPFFLEELVARIRLHLGLRAEAPPRRVRFSGVTVDLDARVARRGEATLPLTRAELDVLAVLVQRPGRAIPREQLAEGASSSLEPCDARTVDSHVARIRKKLGESAAAAIVTVWGIGYRFEPPEGAA